MHETVSPYAEIGHTELIGEFYATEGDPDIGRELSVRIFEHAGFDGDPRAVPLNGRDGTQVQENGQSLTLADYVNFAAVHHFEALENILEFLMMKPGEQDYVTMRATILSRLEPRNR